MAKYDDNFTDSTETTLYQLDITSENGESLTFDDLDDQTIRRVVELVEEATAEPEEEASDQA